MQRRLSAIFASDIVGYSSLMARDEVAALSLLNDHQKQVLTPEITRRGGRVVKLMGDGLLAEFASVVDAVEAAIAIQTATGQRDDGLSLRIGVHLGDVIVEGDDIFGDGVNIAARLEAAARPGGVCVSDLVHQSIRSKVDASFSDLGKKSLKNIAGPVRIWQWTPEARGAAAPDVEELRATRASVAVLPFDNMSGDPDQVYFSDGISEDIITDLSKNPAMFVVARNSSFAFRSGDRDLRDVADSLGVRYLLEGSVRKAGDRVRITAQLIDGTTGGHVWADRFDRELNDVFAIQDEITGRIVSALDLALAPRPDKAGSGPGADPAAGPGRDRQGAAYDLVLRARHLSYRFTRDTNAEADTLFRAAIEADPSLGAAHWGRSINLNIGITSGWVGSGHAVQAMQSAETAVALDPSDVLARRALALACLWDRDLDRALGELDFAVATAPSTPILYATRGYVLVFLGLSDRAVSDLQKAMRLDSHHPDIWRHFLGHALYLNRQFEAAAQALEDRIAREPQTDISRALLAACYGQLDRPEDARAAWRGLLEVNPDYSVAEKGRTLPYRHAADWDLVLEGYRKAGIEV